MTTFYRDSAVYVGSDGFQVDDQAYRLADLELVWHRRGPRGAPRVALVAGRFLLVFVILGGVVAAVFAMGGIDLEGYSTGTILAGAVAGTVLACAIGLFVVEGVITLIERSYETGGAEHQIWARHSNTDVLLFATRDKLRFGKIYRALQRAIEHSEAA